MHPVFFEKRSGEYRLSKRFRADRMMSHCIMGGGL